MNNDMLKRRKGALSRTYVDRQRGGSHTLLREAVVREQPRLRDPADLGRSERRQLLRREEQESEYGGLRRQNRVDEVEGRRREQGEQREDEGERRNPRIPVASKLGGPKHPVLS